MMEMMKYKLVIYSSFQSHLELLFSPIVTGIYLTAKIFYLTELLCFYKILFLLYPSIYLISSIIIQFISPELVLVLNLGRPTVIFSMYSAEYFISEVF